MASDDDGGSLSITAVSIGVAAVVTFLLWGVACAMYDAARPDVLVIDGNGEMTTATTVRIRPGGGIGFAIAGVAMFVAKSFSMLPQLPQVVGFVFRERLWFAVTAAVILGGVVLFGVFLKRTEAALATPHYKRKRRR